MQKCKNISTSSDWLSPTQRKVLWGFLAFIGLIRILIMFQMPMLDTTEARYAEIARKMVETSDWITPQFDYGVPFWGKPPLHTWVSAIGMELFGVNHFGARIFIFVAGCATLWMLYLWACAIKGRDYALVGIAILASTTLYYLASATVMTDMVMAAGVFLTMAGFYSAISQQKYARLWGYLFFVGLGIGMLAKGPVAVVLAALPIGLWVLLKNRWADTWNRLPWVEGTLLTCCIFLPWYVAAEIKTPGFFNYFIVGEHFHRFLDSGWEGDLYGNGHAEVRGTIWLFWFAAVLPWSFFFLAPLRWTGRLYRGVCSEQDGWTLYLLCWALSPMLFFSMATNILATYVITGLPAMSFLVINLWRYARHSDATPSRGLIRFFMSTASVAAVFFLGAYVVFLVKAPLGMRKSQITLVEKVNDLRGEESGGIYYWQKRYYSAEFYTGGEAKTLETKEKLDALLENQQRDFIVVRKNRIERLPPEFPEHFRFVGTYGRDALYYEIPLSTEPTTLALKL